MPISTKRFTDIRLMISDLLQRGDWDQLFDNCGTNDSELARSVANIFSMFDSRRVWKFIDHVAKLSPQKRRERRASSSVVALTLGRMGQSNTKKAIQTLNLLLSDDHMQRQPVGAALSNLWIYDQNTTADELFNSWIMGGSDNDDLQETAISSSEYLLSRAPEEATRFFTRVLKLDQEDPKFRTAAKASRELVSKYPKAKKILSAVLSGTNGKRARSEGRVAGTRDRKHK